MKKCLLIGGSGYLGNALTSYFIQNKINVISTATKKVNNLFEFNLLQPSSILKLDLKNIKIAFITAAISSPDICSNKFDYAWNLNVVKTAELIKILLDSDIKVVFFSSDTVYGEKTDSFDESFPSNPIGEYAFMKNEIEKMFFDSQNFKTIRLSYVFSKLDKFTSYILNCSSISRPVEVYHPLTRSVIYLEDLLEGLKNIYLNWEKIPEKIINFGGIDNISRIEFAQTIKSIKLRNLEIIKKDPGVLFFKSRAKNINMKSPILKKILNRDPLKFEKAVEYEFKIS